MNEQFERKVFNGIYTKNELVKILEEMDVLKKDGWYFVHHERVDDLKGGDTKIHYIMVKNWNL